MYEYYPLIVVGAIVGLFSLVLLIAYLTVKDKKQTMGFERQIGDREIMGRLLHYAKPYLTRFLLVGAVMLFTIAYDVVSPFIIGRIEETVAGDFEMPHIYRALAVYVSILIVSMVCAYIQAVVLQKTGQRIISVMREDLFVKIESLSHEQLNAIPVGKLVTRVTNDTNAICMMFTNLLVNFVKNIFVIIGVFAAMLVLSYEPLLCAFHCAVYGDFPQVFQTRLPKSEGLYHGYQHLSVRESFRHQDHPDF